MIKSMTIDATLMHPVTEGYRCSSKELDRRAATNIRVLESCRRALETLGENTGTPLSPRVDLQCSLTGDSAALSHVLEIDGDGQTAFADIHAPAGIDSVTALAEQMLSEVVDIIATLNITTDSSQPIKIDCADKAAIQPTSEIVCNLAKDIAKAQKKNASDEKYIITFNNKSYDVTLKPNTPTTHHIGNTEASGLITQPCPEELTLILLQGRSKKKMGFPQDMMADIDDFYIQRAQVVIQYAAYETYHCGSQAKGEERRVLSIRLDDSPSKQRLSFANE